MLSKAALLLVCATASVKAEICYDGCNTGVCDCVTPAFVCNPQGGECILGVCSGSCQMAPWLIGVLATVGALILLGCVWCCCGQSIVETCCCQKKQTVTVGGSTAVAVSLSTPSSNPTIINNVAASSAPARREWKPAEAREVEIGEFEEFMRYRTAMAAMAGAPARDPAAAPAKEWQ